MVSKDIYVVNVFSENGLKGGNQLGILPDAGNLTTEQMQTITKQLNYSESTFITGLGGKEVEFRIFIPNSEIEYAGHPIIGTMFLQEYIYRETFGRDRTSLIAKVKAGEVNVTFKSDLSLTFMDQLPVESRGTYNKKKGLLKSLGLEEKDLLYDKLLVLSPSKIDFVYIAVKNGSIVQNIDPDFAAMKKLFGKELFAPYVFSNNGTDGGDVHARMFAPNSGINEDPATGSAQRALIHAMHKMNLLDNRDLIVVEQGYEMNRKSKLHNKVIYDENFNVTGVQTGGKCYIALEGQIFV